MRVEWDEKKNRLNRKKHGILFQLAREAFADPFRLLIPDRTVGVKRDSGRLGVWRI
jgi:uncharacterized DUF497 family protein